MREKKTRAMQKYKRKELLEELITIVGSNCPSFSQSFGQRKIKFFLPAFQKQRLCMDGHSDIIDFFHFLILLWRIL